MFFRITPEEFIKGAGILKERDGLSRNQIARNLNMSTGIITNWKNRGMQGSAALGFKNLLGADWVKVRDEV